MESKMNDPQLDEKVVLTTDVIYGIDFKIAKFLAETGATIVFSSSSSESVEQGLEDYRAAGVETRGYVYDVTDEEQVQAMVAQIKEEVGSIGVLVNDAGVIKQILMVGMLTEEFRQVIDVDSNAPLTMAEAVIPDMIEKGHGKIINICSMVNELGHETVSTYITAKGRLKMLTKNIASEYGQYNIQCNGIGPGHIEAPQMASSRGSRHPFNESILERTPVNRWGTPADLAGLVVFLVSNASGFVNGHTLYVDGGILAYTGEQP